jgi:hypothetical protein
MGFEHAPPALVVPLLLPDLLLEPQAARTIPAAARITAIRRIKELPYVFGGTTPEGPVGKVSGW